MIRLDTLSTELLLFIFENLQDSLPSLCSLRLTCHLFSVLGCGSLQPYFRRKTIVFCSRSVDKLREISQHSSFRESILEVRLLYLQFDVQVLEDALAKAPDQLPRVRRFCDEQLAFEQSATDALNEVFTVCQTVRPWISADTDHHCWSARHLMHIGNATLDPPPFPERLSACCEPSTRMLIYR